MKELINIQSELKAPKSQHNNFGNYDYRNLEDICEALKPLLNKYECYTTISDEIVLIGDRYYIKATVTITNKDGKSISNTAYARESLDKKGMDASQITGATSSYARKYAMNGLFLIDDTKDADSLNNEQKSEKVSSHQKSETNNPTVSQGLVRPSELATEAQLYTIHKMGGKSQYGITKKQASDLITQLAKK